MAYPIVESSKEKMEKSLHFFREELTQIRTGQASTNLVDRVEVDYYGSPTPLKQIASITIQEGRTLVIKPFDPSSLKEIEHACNAADLGITPNNDGTVIRLTVPALTGETRKEMTKKVGKMEEDAKVQIRNIRRDAMTAIKKDKDVPEDVQKDQENEIQKLTDKFVKEIEEVAAQKNKEVLTV